MRVLEEEILNKLRGSVNSLDLAEFLILNGRIEMEIGMFPKAEAHLTEAGTVLQNNESDNKTTRYYKLQCKRDHVLAKVLTRSNYLQKALDHITSKIKAFEGLKSDNNEIETLRLKYLCKLYEALGHLYCDPYMFEEGERELNKAEKIYKDNTDKLTIDLYRRFLMKKSSFLKKSGFFVEAYEILDNL